MVSKNTSVEEEEKGGSSDGGLGEVKNRTFSFNSRFHGGCQGQCHMAAR